MSDRIPDFFLEQYLLGETDARTAERIESDPDALARVAQLEKDNEEILRRYPTGWAVEQISQRASRERLETGNRRTLWTVLQGLGRRLFVHPYLIPAIGLAVLGAILLPRFMVETTAVTGEMPSGERMKGIESQLRIYRGNTSGIVEALSDGAIVAEGDHLQLSYRAASAPYGSIFSIDGRGTVTLHFPDSVGESTRLSAEPEVALPFAYVLDDAPRYELFFFLASPEPVPVAELLEGAAVAVGTDLVGDPVELATSITGTLEQQLPETATIQNVTLVKAGDSQ